MRKNKVRLLFLLLSLPLNLTDSSSKERTMKTSSDCSSAESLVDNETRVFSDNVEEIFSSSRFSFRLKKKSSQPLKYDADGLTVASIKNLETEEIFNIRIEKNESSLFVFPEGNDEGKSFYFFRDSTGKVSCSDLSMDTAKKELGISSASLYTGTRIGGIGFIPITGPVIPVKSRTLTGKFSWKDSKGTEFPLVGAEIKLTTKSGIEIKKSTDKNGEAVFSFKSQGGSIVVPGGPVNDRDSLWSEIENNQYSLYLSLSSSYICSIDDDRNVYSIELPISLVSGTSEKNIGYCFTPSSDFGQMAEIYQSLYYYSSHAVQTILPTNSSIKLSQCFVQFPSTKTSTAGYSRSSNTIYISNSSSNNKSLKCYEAWDVFGHEYGHHLENSRKFSVSIGEDHYSSNDDCSYIYYFGDYQKNGINRSDWAKQRGLRLAWTESWPTFWATMAQDSFPNAIKDEKYLSVGDDRYYASNFKTNDDGSYRFDEYSPKKNNENEIDYLKDIQGGDGCEMAIIRFLYHLWTGEKDGTGTFSVSEEKLMHSLTSLIKQGFAPEYFYEYLEELQMTYGYQKISELADCYHLCPGKPWYEIYNKKNVIRWYDKKTFSNYFNGDYFDCDARRNNKFFIGLYDHLGGNPVKRLNNNEPISPVESHDTMFYTLTNEEISYIKSMPECYVSLSSYYKFSSSDSELRPIGGPFAKIAIK